MQAWSGGGTTPPHHARDRQNAQHRRGCGQAANAVRKRCLQLAAKHAPRRHDYKKGRKKSARLEGVRSLGGHADPTFVTVGCLLSAAMAATCALADRVSEFLRNERRTWSAVGPPTLVHKRDRASRECSLHQHTGRNAHDKPVRTGGPSTAPTVNPVKMPHLRREDQSSATRRTPLPRVNNGGQRRVNPLFAFG